MATKVYLRKKLISGGMKQSLYLDFFPPIHIPRSDKTTRREFLGKYLFTTRDDIWELIEKREMRIEKLRESHHGENKRIQVLHDEIDRLKKLLPRLKPLTQLEKEHNKSTWKIANQILSRRENQLSKPEVYDDFEREQLRIKELSQHDFIAYFREMVNKRRGSNNSNWNSALRFFEKYTGGSLKFGELDVSVLEGFKDYLMSARSLRTNKTELSQNTASSYFNKVKAVLKQAYKDGRLQADLNTRIKPIELEETKRNFLTLEELNGLAQTPCQDPVLKRAALFSALTGLRMCDIMNLTWKDIESVKDHGYFLNFAQLKTGGKEYMPISDQAYELMGKPDEADRKVFEGFMGSAYHKTNLMRWILAAGITKHITFHCFRHTYATLQLQAKTDIYTISKMLGHKSVKTTQIYAKVVDELKKEATEKIKLNLTDL